MSAVGSAARSPQVAALSTASPMDTVVSTAARIGSPADVDVGEEEGVAGPCCPHVPCTRPCEHNIWSDLRTRKGTKVLLCKVCFAKWRICVCRCSEDRCAAFRARGSCPDGSSCPMIHIDTFRPVKRGSRKSCARPTPPQQAPVDASSLTAEGPASSQQGAAPRELRTDSLVTAASAQAGTPMATPPSDDCSTGSRAFINSSSVHTGSSGGPAGPTAAWSPPICIPVSGEYFEELDGYEPPGVALTEEQLDAHMRRLGYS
eukprot:TRINITY_DN9341_c0_g1_i1.p1 TRINITY_DN9341_c0_g1~~TRINITY_DN9341_c0_g1_i1.p1  ORF type:complete len:260 (+),score=29.90 TRINITY_DN9341_c0_g1_i1:70-849(+)